MPFSVLFTSFPALTLRKPQATITEKKLLGGRPNALEMLRLASIARLSIGIKYHSFIGRFKSKTVLTICLAFSSVVFLLRRVGAGAPLMTLPPRVVIVDTSFYYSLLIDSKYRHAEIVCNYHRKRAKASTLHDPRSNGGITYIRTSHLLGSKSSFRILAC